MWCLCVFSQSNDERDISDENGEEAEDQINCENKGQYLHARILLCWQQQWVFLSTGQLLNFFLHYIY